MVSFITLENQEGVTRDKSSGRYLEGVLQLRHLARKLVLIRELKARALVPKASELEILYQRRAASLYLDCALQVTLCDGLKRYPKPSTCQLS